MKKKVVIATALLILLTTITSSKKNLITNFNLKEIKVENNLFVEEDDVKILLSKINNKNLFFLKNKEIENALLRNTFIDSFKIKKIYPNTIKIVIFEKKPIAILINKKKKYYISNKLELIEFIETPIFKDLPYVLGNIDEFKLFYNNLRKTNFPLNLIEKYILFDSNRWDLEIENKKIIKLPSKNYNESITNFLELKKYENFSLYKVFDYRIKDQVIIK